MGCGCKKNKTTQTVAQPTEITVNVDSQTTNETPTLTEEQQKTVDEIIAKLNQINQ